MGQGAPGSLRAARQLSLRGPQEVTCVFADTSYWIAMASPGDQWSKAAVQASSRLRDVHITTTDEVLIEFMNAFAKYGKVVKKRISEIVREILSADDVTVVSQSRDSFLAGFQLYQNRLDQGCSATDCISMAAMKKFGIHQALTTDRHFEAEGFIVLLR